MLFKKFGGRTIVENLTGHGVMSLLLYEFKLRELDDSTLNNLSIMSEDSAKLEVYPDSDE